MDHSVIQSLWIGERLSVMEQLSIRSYLDQGHPFHLYVYSPVEPVLSSSPGSLSECAIGCNEAISTAPSAEFTTRVETESAGTTTSEGKFRPQ